MTVPSAGATIGVPFAAAISSPLCGFLGCLLKKRRRPNGLLYGPSVV